MKLLTSVGTAAAGQRNRSYLACLAQGKSTATAQHPWYARDYSTPSTPSTSASTTATRARRFWTSDDPLLKALRRRQETYRLAQLGGNARKKSDRDEAVQLAHSEIRWIVQHLRKLQAAGTSSQSKQALNRESRRQLVSMAVQMTRNNVPVSYLLGSMPFGTLPQELTVRPPILLPRPETEHWATEVVDLLAKTEYSQLEKVRIVDLCTGSGCIALLVADALRTRLGAGGSWRVVACDRSPQAVELAQENAAKLGFTINEHDSNLHIVQADVFDDTDMDRLAKLAGGPFDLILSNPPYIPRREWLNLPAEVKQHEDPAALIGERDASRPHEPEQSSSNGRQEYLDRIGLAFHERLAQLLYRSTFSTSTQGLPRLVAEYGKGQQANVERLHLHLTPPKDRLPKIIKVNGQLVVVGVGNATTHPNTRHSIGQVVLDPLFSGLVEQDRVVRARLREVRDVLEQGRLVHASRAGWDVPVPTRLAELDLDAPPPTLPSSLLKVTGPSGGWTATLPLLVPSSPRFFSSRNPEDATVYRVDVSLFKPAHAMNRSGVALKAFLASHGAECSADRPPSDDVLVLQDELDLPFGEAKRREAGSARGHNGVRDIIARLAIPVEPTKCKGHEGPKLSRVRIGIGRPTGKGTRVDRWVLSPLSDDEMHSCQTSTEGSVLTQVQRHTLEWIRERCTTLAREMGTDAEKHERVSSRKDQFGVLRTVWVS